MAGEATMRRVGMICEPSPALGLTMPRAVYAACAPLACARCRRAIAVGDQFTRRVLVAGAGPLPVCRTCAPFEEVGG